MFYSQDVMQDYGRLSGRHTALETALVSTPLFREHSLHLYRQDIFFLSPSWERIDYLIVKEHVPVLKFILSPWRPKDSDWYTPGTKDEPPLLVVCTKKPRLQDLVDDVTTHLEPLLKSRSRPYWKCDTYMPVPPEHHGDMARLHMIMKQEDYIWARTPYGASLGLIDGYMVTKRGKPCHTFFIQPWRWKELYVAINWSQTCWDEPETGISLAQRMEKARQGLPLSNTRMIEEIRAFGAMPMADYMASDADSFELLRQQFGEMATFQEAADRVFEFCKGRSDRYDCMEPIAALCIPLINVREEKAPVNQAAKTVQELMRRPFSSVLTGAAMAARQPCLLRNIKFIRDMLRNIFFDMKEDKLLATTCWKAFYEAAKSDEEDFEESSCNSADLFFYLIVEPFAMLNRAAVYPCPEPMERDNNMDKNISKDVIENALKGKMPDSFAHAIADILCGQTVQPIMDYVLQPAASEEKARYGRSRYEIFNSERLLIDLPAKLFCYPWMQDRQEKKLGRYTSLDFYNLNTRDATRQACEVLILAEALRTAYGPDNLPELVEEHVFSQPLYAAFRSIAEPLLIQYIY